MQSRSETWKALAKTGTSLLNSVAVIDGKEYSSTSAPVISRGLFSSSPSVGNCTAASLQISILTEDEIPKSAEVQVKMRLLEEVGGAASEWLPAGTFYINKRDRDYSSGLITLECYDAMLRAQADYFESDNEIDTDLWPRPMSEVLLDIAKRMGVEIDSRTTIRAGEAYRVTCPEDRTMMDVLGYIGAAHGGNWCITPEGKLRLVPFVTAPDDSTADALDVVAVLSKLTTGKQLVISGVSISDDSGANTYIAGDESGYALKISANPYASQTICDDLYAAYGGLAYNPFTASKAIYDPAAELGDPVRYNGLVYSVLVVENVTLNTMFSSTVQAPTSSEYEDEYPYLSSQKKTTNAIQSEIDDLVTVIADKASISDLYAIYAVIENLSAADIKTGIIYSSDYSTTIVPYLYPAYDLFPAEDIYPSNGQQVLTGFAIDFSTGMIYGAFYSAQIEALEEAVDAIDIRLRAVEDADYGGEISALRETISGLTDKLTSLQDAIKEIQEADSARDKTIGGIEQNVSTLQNGQTDIKNDIQSLQTGLNSAQDSLDALAKTVSGNADTIQSIQSELVTINNDIVTIQRNQNATDETVATHTEAISGLDSRITSLETASTAQSEELKTISQNIDAIQASISTMQAAIEALQNSLTYPKS